MNTIASPRSPLDVEKTELLLILQNSVDTEQYDIAHEEVVNLRHLIDSAYIAVFDSYSTESRSGYAGKLMTVVWSTEPAAHEVFVWRHGSLQQIRSVHTANGGN